MRRLKRLLLMLGLLRPVQSNAIVPCLFTHLADRQYKKQAGLDGFPQTKKTPQ